MSRYILKSKLYSEEKGSTLGGTLAKVGTGIAAGVGLFAGARRGMFGSAMSKASNIAYGNAGKMIGGKVGDNMILNAAEHHGNNVAKSVLNKSKAKLDAALKNGKISNITEDMLKGANMKVARANSIASNGMLNRFV